MITSCPVMRGSDPQVRETNNRSKSTEDFHLRLEVGVRGMILKEIIPGDVCRRRASKCEMVRTRGGSEGGESTSPRNRMEWDGNINGVHLHVTISLLRSGNLKVKAEASRGKDELTVKYSAENSMFLGINVAEIPVIFQRIVLTLLDPEKSSISLGEGSIDVSHTINDFEVTRKGNINRKSVPRTAQRKGNTAKAGTENDIRKIQFANRSWRDYSSGRRLWKEFLPGSGIVGAENSPLEEVVELIFDAASDDVPVLIIGESGSGKELVARAIHNLSRRRSGPFETVNCALGPDNLLESKFFGHEKGAFTGATSRTIGHFENAHTGSIFLDEIGDMSYELQTKLLRALEEKKIQRLGGAKEIEVDLRVISATHWDLKKAREERWFRDDLYFRVKGHGIHIPPLREREGDIPALIDFYAGKENKHLTEPLFKALLWCEWTGNVRELKNLMESCKPGAQGTIDISDIKDSEDSVKVKEAFERYLDSVKEAGLCDEKAKVVNELVVILTQMLQEAWGYSERESDSQKEERRNAAVHSARMRFREFLLSQGHNAVQDMPPESTCRKLLNACYPKGADKKYIMLNAVRALQDNRHTTHLCLSNKSEGRRFETLENFMGISYKWLPKSRGAKKTTRIL